MLYGLCMYKLKHQKMKKILTIIATAAMFAACSNDKDLDTNKDVVLTDTSGMYKSNYSTDVSPVAANKEEVAPATPTRVIRETRVVYVDRTPKATKQTIHEASPVEPVTAPVEQTQTNTGTSTLPGTTTPGSTGTVGTNTGNESGTTTPDETEKKTGWSKAAKGAVIGGVGGAVAGAILSKKKGKGAIIGGVIGAAGGYILGRKKDKADEANNTPQYTSY